MNYELNIIKHKTNIIRELLKDEVVFTISLIFAVVTSLISVPKMKYIDFKVLGILFNLMVVIAAFEKLKILDKIAVSILSKFNKERQISLVLIFLTFISSMFITNDVALITFVPLTLIIGKKTGWHPILTIIFQTLAANLGSSLTPMGNPQNLFLYSFYNISPIEFFKVTLPIILIGILWLVIINYRLKENEINFKLEDIYIENKTQGIIYIGLFIFVVLSVFNIVNYKIAFLVTIFIAIFTDKSLLKQVDYILLATFICFFIIIGNLSHMPSFTSNITKFLSSSKNVYFSSILFSQAISNVPSAILLSGFTSRWKEIILGVNIGGMGTLIASLASLISYKFYIKEYGQSRKYLIHFHGYSIISLFIFSFIIYFLI
ncbi:SLC13 family permease [Clostridium sp. HMP27]|uniref:SLC13 family permease n=1 Tax=Clostridium sp. HMP27 TaxID=1487921 RepID=UPI000A751BBC|nr:SLC13 family permease [Clostridium sp. HMP27]